MRGVESALVLKTPYGRFCSEKSESMGMGNQEAIVVLVYLVLLIRLGLVAANVNLLLSKVVISYR
jgi:hypothetical protein